MIMPAVIVIVLVVMIMPMVMIMHAIVVMPVFIRRMMSLTGCWCCTIRGANVRCERGFSRTIDLAQGNTCVS